VGCIAVFCLFVLTPSLVLLPQGIALPAKSSVPAPLSSEVITIYTDMPDHETQRLGRISVEQGFWIDDDTTKQLVLQKVKQLAAGIGANGVVIQTFIAGQSEGIGRIFSFIGTAILVT